MRKYQLNFLFFILLIICNISYSAEDRSSNSNLNRDSGIISNDRKKNTKGGWSSSGGDIDFNEHHLINNNNITIAGGDSAGGAVGGTGGTSGGGGSKTLKRSIASVTDEIEFDNQKLNAAKKCLKKLNSSYIPNSISSSEEIASIKKEIFLSVDKFKSENKTIDSVHFPECVFYANETKDIPIKNLFYKARTPSSEPVNNSDSSSTSK